MDGRRALAKVHELRLKTSTVSLVTRPKHDLLFLRRRYLGAKFPPLSLVDENNLCISNPAVVRTSFATG